MLHQLFNSYGSHIYNGIVYKNQQFGPNFHNSFEFYYIIKGESCVTIGTQSINLKTGDCLLISPNLMHSLKQLSDEHHFFTAVFSADFVHSFFKNTSYIPFYKFVPEKETLDYWLKYLIYTGTPDIYTLKACLYAVCAQAVNLSPISTASFDTKFISLASDYIINHFNENFSRKDIASALNYEEHYFSRLFNENFGLTLGKYTNLLRFNQACEQLLHTENTIISIAFDCGFANVRNFNRIFKEFSGLTPKQYRSSIPHITEPDVLNQKIVIPNLH